jgi:OOP family OmpA-OmpF porin
MSALGQKRTSRHAKGMSALGQKRTSLGAEALATIGQAAGAYKTKGSARITATGHTDTSGPENYNMALSLRRANAVKDALVREGVPATAIAVIGRGEQGLLVPTPDGVREPQNRDRAPVRLYGKQR